MVAQLKTLPLFYSSDTTADLLGLDEQHLHEETRRLCAFVARGTGEPYLVEPLRRLLHVSGRRVRSLFPYWLTRALGKSLDGADGEATARVAVMTLALHSAADAMDEGATAQSANAATMLIFTTLQYVGDPQMAQLAIDASAGGHVGRTLHRAFADPRTALPLLDASDDERKARWVDCALLKTSQLMNLSLLATGRAVGAPTELVDAAVTAISAYGVGYQILDDIKSFRPDLIGNKAHTDLPHALSNRVCIELFAMLSEVELAFVRLVYGSAELVEFILQHPKLPMAIALALAEARAVIADVEHALTALCHDESSIEYLRELLRRPIDDLEVRPLY